MIFNTEIIFVRVLVPFMAGIALFRWVAIPFVLPVATLFFISCLCLLFVINFVYARVKAYNFRAATGVLAFLLFFSGGAILTMRFNQARSSDHFSRYNFKELKIVIDDEPQVNASFTRFTARVIYGSGGSIQQNVTGRLSVTISPGSSLHNPLEYGDELIIENKTTETTPPYNPGEFDLQAWLAAKNIYHQAFLNDGYWTKTTRNSGNALIRASYRIRKQQIERYQKIISNSNALAVAATLVLGYRADLTAETINAFSRTGTIHALSVSGAHVAIIYGFINFLLFFLDRKPALRITKTAVICMLLWGYAMLTGFSPSVLRSVVMITVMILAKTLNRSSNAYNVLAFSAFCLLTYDPFLIYDVGFQLSYLAVLGLIFLQPRIYSWLYFRNTYVDKLWNITALSLAAQATTFPLSIYYFHQFPVYFLLGNLFIMLPVNLIMGLGTLVLIPGADFIGPWLEWTINFTNTGLGWIASLPFSGIEGIFITKPVLVLISLSMILYFTCMDVLNKKRLFIASLTLLAGISCFTVDKLIKQHQRFILFFVIKKHYAVAFVNGTQLVLLSDLQPGDKSFSFYIKPALGKFQISYVHVYPLRTVASSSWFSSTKDQVRFFGYRLFIPQKEDQCTNLDAFDLVWLNNEPQLNLPGPQNRRRSPLLIIDATNSRNKTAGYEQTALKMGCKTYVLNKNPAYLINLK